PANYREAISYLYKIMRAIDDIADNGELEGKPTDTVQYELEAVVSHPDVITFFNDHDIPRYLLQDIAKGVLQDHSRKRYENFEQLHEYCYFVAGTVGRMITHLFGVHDESALKKAEEMGVAMQLTNILRDVEEDLNRNLIYFPNEDMTQFGVSEESIKNKNATPQIKALMKHYVETAWKYYHTAAPGISYLPWNTRLGIKAAWFIYSGILDKIKENDFDPFKGRVYVPNSEKIWRVVRMLLQNA
ncbi:phytoene/squalene synthase family protein, partial [candidate division WWE3 bacterium]|nr:phytoene/squalene synthase family protein [candidate division WWE3 bacterium]